ncbi:MAG: ATP-dependent nuclease, subunit [Gammaproteobacteria bacterium]|jgi:ATP-dependent helicase/nuclease subunit B|nr:ATP-dependent nuclease, subunit [Gammaproteobacteria bacterium]
MCSTHLRQLIVSTSTQVRLQVARAWLETFARDRELLVLVPHAIAANHLVYGLVANQGSRFGLQRFTLSRLAAHIAAPELARRRALPCTSLSLAAVVARAVHRVMEEGNGGHLTPVASRPGFPRALARTFEDLRGAGVRSDQLRGVSTVAPLAPFIETVEKELVDNRLADRAEVFNIAIRTINEQPGWPEGLPVLLLDLPLSDVLEQRLVAAILAHASGAMATAAEGDRTAIEVHTVVLGVAPIRPKIDEHASSLANLQHHLFEDSAPTTRALDATVSLASWPGEARECVEIARRMQVEAARGVPFDRMAVLLRAPGRYRAHLQEALRRASIPAWFARGSTRPDPAGRALLALLACAAEGLTARRFAEYLSLSQVPRSGIPARDTWRPPEAELLPLESGREKTEGESRHEEGDSDPDAPTLEGALRTPWRWERLIVDAAVIGGADRWRRRLQGLKEEITLRYSELGEDDARAQTLARTAETLDHLTTFALPLIEQLAELPRAASWADWLRCIRDLAAAALREPAGVLSVLAELDPLGPVGPVDLAAVQHVLTPRLRDLSVLPESRPNGAVWVAPVEMARGLAFDVVFVPGLAEKLFPQRVLQDPLLPDNARQAVGVPGLATQAVRVEHERLALRLAASAAMCRLALSWPRIEIENARARVPSFYALEALRAAEGRLPGLDELAQRAESSGVAHLGWPAPQSPEEAIDDTEYDLATLAQLKNTDPATSVGAAAYLLGANVHLARALRARARRWRKGWSMSDGLIDPDAETIAALARHRISERAYSPTALESFAVCPYRFLLQAIHQLRPREEIEALDVLDSRTRGALIHEIQFQLLGTLRAERQLPLSAERLEHAFRRLDSTVARVAAEYRERLAPAIARVWEDAIDAIRLDLREWLRRLAAEAQQWTPSHFELAFGLPEHLRREADPASVSEPVKVLGRALLRGSIDLIEHEPHGSLRVTDHKTGKSRVPENTVVWGGRALQPVLYALVTEALFRKPVASGRLYYCTTDGEFTERVFPLDDGSRANAQTVLDIIDRAIEQGFLPAVPLRDACDTCDYRIVCGPHENVRVSRKRSERLADLTALRALP